MSIDIKHFHDSLQHFSAATSVEQIEELVRLHCGQMGFDTFIYALRVPTCFADSRLVLIKGYPDAWVEHYFAQGYYEHDPVMAYCAGHIVPVQWHDLAQSLSGRGKRIMNEAGEFGLKDGLTMPVHSPHGELGILSFALNRQPGAAREITGEAMPYVQLLAGYLHESTRRVLGLIDDADKFRLSDREKACLRWAADGKTSWEIARLMHLSERTVNFYLNNAVQKLDASNRQHAVAKAAMQGLIHPQPF